MVIDHGWRLAIIYAEMLSSERPIVWTVAFIGHSTSATIQKAYHLFHLPLTLFCYLHSSKGSPPQRRNHAPPQPRSRREAPSPGSKKWRMAPLRLPHSMAIWPLGRLLCATGELYTSELHTPMSLHSQAAKRCSAEST
jgi:hypothetical protein